MKTTLKWEKVSPKENYLIIPNKLITDLCSNADALALILLVLSNKSGYFDKKGIYDRLNWTWTNIRKWTDAINFLKENGYVYADKGSYTFSNIPQYKKEIKPAEPTKDIEKEKKCNIMVDDSNIGVVTVEELMSPLGCGFDDSAELPF